MRLRRRSRLRLYATDGATRGSACRGPATGRSQAQADGAQVVVALARPAASGAGVLLGQARLTGAVGVEGAVVVAAAVAHAVLAAARGRVLAAVVVGIRVVEHRGADPVIGARLRARARHAPAGAGRGAADAVHAQTAGAVAVAAAGGPHGGAGEDV